jgi:hypothetical protein
MNLSECVAPVEGAMQEATRRSSAMQEATSDLVGFRRMMAGLRARWNRLTNFGTLEPKSIS